MNLFQKYGIKEVADVVFYSITDIGDEEFYTPVLFLDTLKVSTLEKAAEKVEAKGGKGNKKLITWNFGKEVTLNLEDALFSPASMSMIWGGKLDSKLSDYTSAIVKCNLANKYGDLHYSTKAYPSPALTDNEWEIIFKEAHELGLDSGSGNTNPSIYIENESGSNKEYVAENRISVIKKYFQRTWKEFSYEIPPEFIGDKVNYQKFFTNGRQELTPILFKNDGKLNRIGYYATEAYLDDDFPTLQDLLAGTPDENGVYTVKTSLRYKVKQGSFSEYNSGKPNTWEEGGAWTWRHDSFIDLIFRYIIVDEKICADPSPGQIPIRLTATISNTIDTAGLTDYNLIGGTSISCKDTYGFLKTVYGEENVISGDEYTSLVGTNAYAMPSVVINNIVAELNTLDRIGYIDTDIHDLEVIDRMEKCIVKDRKGMKISSLKQKQNLFRYYADDRTSTYTIFYDAKTMLPLFSINENGEISDEDFKIKMGTVYYKWTRTVKYKESEDDAILGRTLVIDAETFPDAYKIVGETYIRNQKTGKDQRYQFIIHRANVSSDTSVTLEAEGDPTTFSMQVDVLTPPNDIMMELKQYDVEEDILEGGTRIVPQKSKYTYTPTNIEYIQEIAEKNNEIY